MRQSIERFLEFNGKTLLFLAKDGTFWIAIKPVCEALNVQYVQQFKNLKVDPILGPALCKHTMQVPGDQLRNMVCLPEYLVYGWIFSINSPSPELLEYKKQCYEILFNFFHGSITRQQELIKQKALIQKELGSLEADLVQDERFLRYQDLKKDERKLGYAIKDWWEDQVDDQLELF